MPVFYCLVALISISTKKLKLKRLGENYIKTKTKMIFITKISMLPSGMTVFEFTRVCTVKNY
jgi:hypothetical protein